LNQVSRNLERKTHQCVKKFSTDIENNFHFNTCISAVMELTNLLLAAPDNDRQEEADPHIIQADSDGHHQTPLPHGTALLRRALGDDRP